MESYEQMHERHVKITKDFYNHNIIYDSPEDLLHNLDTETIMKNMDENQQLKIACIHSFGKDRYCLESTYRELQKILDKNNEEVLNRLKGDDADFVFDFLSSIEGLEVKDIKQFLVDFGLTEDEVDNSAAISKAIIMLISYLRSIENSKWFHSKRNFVEVTEDNLEDDVEEDIGEDVEESKEAYYKILKRQQSEINLLGRGNCFFALNRQDANYYIKSCNKNCNEIYSDFRGVFYVNRNILTEEEFDIVSAFTSKEQLLNAWKRYPEYKGIVAYSKLVYDYKMLENKHYNEISNAILRDISCEILYQMLTSPNFMFKCLVNKDMNVELRKITGYKQIVKTSAFVRTVLAAIGFVVSDGLKVSISLADSVGDMEENTEMREYVNENITSVISKMLKNQKVSEEETFKLVNIGTEIMIDLMSAYNE